MDKMQRKFVELFGHGDSPSRWFCPGRVNLIGGHIDYLGGSVFPAAISLGVTGLIRKNLSDNVRVYSTDFDQLIEFNLAELPEKKQGNWGDYVLGVLLFLTKKGIPISGFDLMVDSTLPKGSGLSSSAALEVLVYYSLYKIYTGNEPDRTGMALDCQQIENEFIGVNCGIMDQFAVANGKQDHGIQLNCGTLEHIHVPLKLGEHVLLIINSNKPRKLAESAYNQRRNECDEALRMIRASKPHLIHLVDADATDVETIENPTIRKRAMHAITENLRVHDSAKALRDNDLETFGKLMNASHVSLSEDFEVSCNELDFIAKFLQEQEGCLGARMTGAGFGGCCVAIVEDKKAIELIENLSLQYEGQFGISVSTYTCAATDGVGMLVND